jgi:hypothetical protein
MSGSEMHRVLGRYESAAAGAPVRAQLAYASLKHAIDVAVAAGVMPSGVDITGAVVSVEQTGPPETRYRRSLTDQAVELIGGAIIGGELLNGQSVSVKKVAQQLGVSRSPVADAFRVLKCAGLLSSGRSVAHRVSTRYLPKKA